MLQYLGRISYSLYLIHFSVLRVVIRAGANWAGDDVLRHVVLLGVAFIAAVVSADVLYRLIEAPAMRWASRIPRDRHGLKPPVTQTSGF